MEIGYFLWWRSQRVYHLFNGKNYEGTELMKEYRILVTKIKEFILRINKREITRGLILSEKKSEET